MFFFHPKPSRLPLFFCILLAFSFSISAQDKDWRPVTPEELASKTAVVEPGADAEVLFWEVRVDDSDPDSVGLKHYVRVKIFTEHGRDQYSKYDIPYEKNTKIKNVEARVTKPDGSVVYLKDDDVIDRDVVKASGLKIKAKSFALPGLEVGSILEYRYRESSSGLSATMPLIFQHDIPIQTISFYVKPFQGEAAMNYIPFNAGETKFEKDKSGFFRATMKNLPALREEPSMPPENEVRSWIYIFYDLTAAKNADDYWSIKGRQFYEKTNSLMKPNGDVKSVTEQIIAGATSDEEKLHRIFDYAKTQIKNLTYSTNVSDDERKTAMNIHTGGDVLKNKFAFSGDVDILFASMARAAGFDARLALSGNRSEMSFDRRTANVNLMLNSSSIAVKVGNDWRFFSPAEYFTPYGMLGWVEENQQALITDPKEPIWQMIPLATAERSMEKRTGKFKLLEDGTLEGEGRIEYTGHRSSMMKDDNLGDSDSVRENSLKNYLRRDVLGSVEVEAFTIENANDPEKPFAYTFKIRVPGYASRTGKRLFFQPNVFERSTKPRFVSNTRKYDIHFNYPFSVNDDITIELPPGFSLESPDAPVLIQDKEGVAVHEIKMSILGGGKSLLSYKRKFSFGNGGRIGFPASTYPLLKQFFEAFNKADAHQLTLKQDAAVSAPTK